MRQSFLENLGQMRDNLDFKTSAVENHHQCKLEEAWQVV